MKVFKSRFDQILFQVRDLTKDFGWWLGQFTVFIIMCWMIIFFFLWLGTLFIDGYKLK